MGFVEAVKTCYGPNYARFSGRAARSEYWYFMLLHVLVLLCWLGLAVALFLPALDRMLPQFFDVAVSLAMLAIFIVTILKGTEGRNRFGPDPLATRAREEIFA